MTVADSTRRRLGCVVPVACAVLLAGCGSTVPGRPATPAPTTVTRHVSAELPTLLPDPAQFPPPYAAVTLPQEAVAQAAGDLDGMGRGANVQPSRCVPPHQDFGPDRTAMAVGTDDATRATLTVELTRTGEPLTSLRARTQQCGSVRVSRAGATTTVTTELDSPPPIDADDALSLRRIVRPESGGAGLTQSMRTHVGQIGDVRITVTYMSFAAGEPDSAALDALFATAVRKVRER
ncbi:sensor domain-containing protein [Nocardia gipuzkoensis]|uniref:sensor domain-containing protein n=1 Tax=Nocardia gipuzkoensis TaxID=2749991 RepID=UPI001E611DD2|nr:sensor domain-containing protein [Nocardia gipuzkoensis]UGT66439.1 sensor domain-containing protein [Nocardia gipuzkoensis]